MYNFIFSIRYNLDDFLYTPRFCFKSFLFNLAWIFWCFLSCDSLWNDLKLFRMVKIKVSNQCHCILISIRSTCFHVSWKRKRISFDFVMFEQCLQRSMILFALKSLSHPFYHWLKCDVSKWSWNVIDFWRNLSRRPIIDQQWSILSCSAWPTEKSRVCCKHRS